MKALFYIAIIFIATLYSSGAKAQYIKIDDGYLLPAELVDGDTLALIKLPLVYVFPPLQMNEKEYVQYTRLVRNVKVAYPYAMLAKNTFIDIQKGLAYIPTEKARKQFVKEKEKELLVQYSKELKNLTISQGRILLKLVDRELNQTSFEIIKDMRGGFQAAMWQGIARLFGETLKSEYDAKGEDLLIERIVIMIEQGVL